MTQGEQKMLRRGVAAGTLIGVAIGGLAAIMVAMRPEFLTALVQ